MANQRTKTAVLVSALLAASLSTACARRQYGYGFETAGVASSGKAVIARGGVDATTHSTFSEAAFLGSPIYIGHLHLTTAMGAVKTASHEGAVSICIKKPLVWKRSNASTPAGTGCGAGIRALSRRRPLAATAERPIARLQTMIMGESSNFAFLTIRRCELRSRKLSTSAAILVLVLYGRRAAAALC